MESKASRLIAVVLILAAVVYVAVSTRQVHGGSPVAQAWEYKALSLAIAGNNVTLYEDGKQIPGGPPVNVKANELGANGWELVSVAASSTNQAATFVYWFKRPR